MPFLFPTPAAGAAWCESPAGPGWGAHPCTSTVFDWRDGVLAPEAEWVALLNDHLCAVEGAMAGTADFMLSERADRSLTECKGSSRYLRSQYTLGMPRKGIPMERDGMDVPWAEHAADYRNSKFGDELLPGALDKAMAEHSATPPLARVTASAPQSGKPISVCWAAWITTNVLSLVYQASWLLRPRSLP